MRTNEDVVELASLLLETTDEPTLILSPEATVIRANPAEDRALEHAELARAVVECSGDAIVCVTVDAVILSWNPAAARLYGFSRAEALGRPLDAIFRTDLRNELLELQAKVVESKQIEFVELEGLSKSGDSFLVASSVSPLMDGDRTLGSTWVMRDASSPRIARKELERRVEDRTRELEIQKQAAVKLAEEAEQARIAALEVAAALRRSEVQLRQSQKMEAVGRLAGGVAHDFNNILTAIMSFSAFVMDELKPESQAFEDMEELQKAARRAQSLTSQLLAFSRKRTVEPKILDPNEEINGLRSMLDHAVGEQTEVITHLSVMARSIRIDSTALEQVMVNLAVNARDAMPSGGRLVIETALVSLEEGCRIARGVFVPPGEYVTISVSDTGVGMDQATQQHIFEPFFTTKDVGKGTGLGLSTVYGIVEQADGFLGVYSELGKGTTFRIYLPALNDAPTVFPPASAKSLERGMERILIVEDDAQLRGVCRRALESRGYEVLVAENAEEALQICAQRIDTIDLLLTDVIMPRMSGRQLATRFARLSSDTRVLFMSGYSANTITHHGALEPGVVLLEKPFTPETLGRKVREVLDADADYSRDLLARKPLVLVVDSEPESLDVICRHLEDLYELVTADSSESALREIKLSEPEVVICPWMVKGLDTADLHASVVALMPHLADRFVFTIEESHEELMDRPRRAITKPFDRDELCMAVASALEI